MFMDPPEPEPALEDPLPPVLLLPPLGILPLPPLPVDVPADEDDDVPAELLVPVPALEEEVVPALPPVSSPSSELPPQATASTPVSPKRLKAMRRFFVVIFLSFLRI
jgi:hypothetical protein